MGRILLLAAAMTMILSIIFGAIGNLNVMYALTALAGVETIFSLFVAHKTSPATVSTTDFWVFSGLVVVGVGATLVFIFPAGLPLFAPAAVAVMREPRAGTSGGSR